MRCYEEQHQTEILKIAGKILVKRSSNNNLCQIE